MLNAILTILVLAFIAFVFLFTYLNRHRRIAHEKWITLLDLLRLRLDKIPGLIEVVRKYSSEEDEKLIQSLIELRADCWPVDRCDKNSVQSGLAVSEKVRKLFALGSKNSELNKDILFMSLRSEFKSIAIEIEENLDIYNKEVRAFNGNILYKIFSPVLGLFGMHKLLIFEFEP